MNEDDTRDESAAERDHAALNLLRLRGELEQARQFGTAVLKKHPNDPVLYELMGEIHLDLKEDDQALSWFEMALDLDPSRDVLKERTEEIRARVAEQDRSETVERLGLPQKSPFPWLLLAVTSIAAVALVFGAFTVGKNMGKDRGTVVSPPVLLNSNPVETSEPAPPVAEPVQEPAPSSDIAVDQALMTRLGSIKEEGVTFLSALHDPRGPSCHVTVAAQPNQSHSVTALRAALAVASADPQFTTVHVRVSEGGSIVYAATARKETLLTVASALAGGDTVEKQAEVALGDTWPVVRLPGAEPERGP